MSLANAGDGGLALADMIRIDEACDRFEATWRSGQSPDLALYLAEAEGPARPRLLRELLALDLEFRLELGMRPEASSYHALFPEHPVDIDAVFALFDPGVKTAPASNSRDAGAGAFPDSSANQATVPGDALPRADLSPATIDALREAGYEILGELGRGGMGVVFLAHKVALNRRCALKMILAGAHTGSVASARFRAEAETIARLGHPDIVQIYHVGAVGGLPYFELEFLPGGSLDRKLDGTPWSAPVAAELIEVLAHAIAEAHRQGIVHRDLKPANILLDAGGRPKVADFGLAKLLDSGDGLTRTQTILGSPSYMAPEQADGRSRMVGATTDVYALGAMFYELLTGRPPFRAATAVETLVQVRDTDPIPPSRFQPGLPRAAETICLKCLEKAPARRYPTAEALDEDLHRFRSGDSILAHPAPPWELAWIWTRRRPAVSAALGVGVAALALLVGGGWYYNLRIRESARKAEAAERSAVTQRNLALNAFDQLVFDVQERLGDTVSTRPLRRALLNTAIQGLDQIARGTEGSAPNLSRAVAHLKLGKIYRQIVMPAEASRQFLLAQRLAEHLATNAPRDNAVVECLRDALAGLGHLNLEAARTGQAKALFRRVVTLSESIVGNEPGRVGARPGLIEAYLQLGRAHGYAGDRRIAEDWYSKMHDLAERWVRDEPRNLLAQDLLSSSLRKLADERKLAEDYGVARVHYLKAIAIGREVLAAEPKNYDFKHHLALAVDDLAGVEYTEYRSNEARSLFGEAERLFTEQVEEDPDNLETQIKLIRVQTRFACLERDESHYPRAAEVFRRALDRLQLLEREGRFDGRPASKDRRLRMLREEIAACESAPLALGDIDIAKSRPAGAACLLFLIRTQTMAAQGRQPEALAAAAALCDLTVDEAEDLFTQAHSLGACLRQLDDRRWPPSMSPSPERQALSRRCADRAVAALNQATQRGFDDIQSIAHDEALAPLRGHPGYRKLADRLGGPPRSLVPSGKSHN